ncbi:hypothetical protein [Halobellus rufus]|uniref:hypothetical protein n=1 Tax=Halobellus rufus TaxID=1448860 RepID=UPI000678E165|nr:hypothetical protein [Halobellus rufus]
MSHRNHGRNLTEWADLIGASLPESVEEREEATGEFGSNDGFGGGFGEGIGSRGRYDFTPESDTNE